MTVARRLIDPGHLHSARGEECHIRLDHQWKQRLGRSARARRSQRESSPAISTNWRQPSVCVRAQHGTQARRCPHQNATTGVEGGGSAETTASPAPCDRKITAIGGAARRASTISSFLPWPPGQTHQEIPLHAKAFAFSPEPCRARDLCPTQAGPAGRRADGKLYGPNIDVTRQRVASEAAD